MTEYDGVERSKTEQLCALLDERGVEYKYRDMFGKHVIHWGTPMVNGAMFTDGGKWTELVIENPTPEQAVEATLGKEMCEVDTSFTWDWLFCDPYWEHELSCGHTITTMEPELPNYCPECGRRIKQ